MDAPAVIVCAVLGALVGWFAIVRVVETIPEPLPLDARARIAVAVVNGALWAFDANQFRRWWIVVTYFVVFSTLLAVSVVDLRLFRIPDRIVFPALGATAANMVVSSFAVTSSTSAAIDVLKFAFAGMLTYFLILLVFHLIYPAGMGFGDVKLALLMGLSLGWLGTSVGNAAYLVTIGLFFGCVIGVVFGLVMRFVSRQKGAFPFGPALALSTVYVILNFQRYLV
jgi:leader peptidase (prepilin peptidase)/N-methyltransferase